MDEDCGREAVLKITLRPLRQLRIHYSMLLVEIEAERCLLLDVGKDCLISASSLLIDFQQEVDFGEIVEVELFAGVKERIDLEHFFRKHCRSVRGQECAPEDSMRHGIVALQSVEDPLKLYHLLS